MKIASEELLNKVIKNFPNTKTQPLQNQESKLIVAHTDILGILKFLKEENNFLYLSNLTAVDYPLFFAVVYHLQNWQENSQIELQAELTKKCPEINSCSALFLSADFMEREVFDMFGIVFLGHPNLTRIYMDEDYNDFPLRKDFAL